MKRLFALLFTLAILVAGCDDKSDRDAATPIPPPPAAPSLETSASGKLPSPSAPSSESALPTVAVSPTSESLVVNIPTVEIQPTQAPSPEPPTQVAATASPDPSTDGPVATSAPPFVEPAPELLTTGLFEPGRRDDASLVEGEAIAYLVNGHAYQPYILFVEPSNELNVALAAYIGDHTDQTTPEGVTPPATADNALAGRPEILVYSPESNGLFTLVVRAVAGQGSFVAHFFDLVTPARGVVVQQAAALAAGTEQVYEVTSNGARPIIVAADPTDQSDIALDILSEDGTLLTTANYSGPGGVETAYVLPLGATSYLVKVREVNGGEANYQALIIALE